MDRERPRPAARGFTLVEMLVVLAIVGLLAGAAWPMLQYTTVRRQEADLRSALRQIRGALDAYALAMEAGELKRPDGAAESGPIWPASLDVLVEGAPRADGRGRRFFLRRLPHDPFAGEWGLRSSDSDPAAPRPGADVFDVHSRSDRSALDGSRYRDW